MKKINKFCIVFCCTLTMLSMTVMAGLATEAEKQEKNVAQVNDTMISVDQFDAEFNRIKQRLAMMGQSFDDQQLSVMRKDVLENMINAELLFQESKKSEITVNEEDIAKQIQGLKQKLGGPDKYAEALKAMSMTEEDLLSNLRKGLAVQQLIESKIGSKITVTDKEQQDFFTQQAAQFSQPEQVRASHILIKVDPQDDQAKKDEARAQIVAVQKRLAAGEDFAAVAKEVSQCPSNAKGGDLGFFRRGQMVKPFEDAAFALQAGQVTDVVETRFGYHLIKVVDKKAASTMEFAEVKDQIEEYLKQQKIKEEVGQYIEELKKSNKVERFLS